MIQEFKNYLISLRGLSENTANEYEKDVRNFAKWMRENVSGARWSTITRAEIDRYIIHEVQRGMKPATTNRKLASIAALYNYMQREGMEVENPCKYESRRKRAEQVPNTIPNGQLKQAYDNAIGATKYMLGILMTTGMRIQEVLDMTWESIDIETNAIRVKGKGGKSRIVYTTSDVLEPVRNAMQYGRKSGKMWSIDQRQARMMIWQALRPYCTATQLSPHAIRHTFATNVAAHGGNVSTLAQILGHKHLETTQKYINMAQSPIRETCQQYNLLN